MSHYSNNAGSVRVDFFKTSGKWYSTESVDMSQFYNEPLIHDALKKALAKGIGRLTGMMAICLLPYHKHSHPISLEWEGV